MRTTPGIVAAGRAGRQSRAPAHLAAGATGMAARRPRRQGALVGGLGAVAVLVLGGAGAAALAGGGGGSGPVGGGYIALPPGAARMASFGWDPPPTIRRGGQSWKLFGPKPKMAALAAAKSIAARYVGAAWCGPIDAGVAPEVAKVAALFPPGTPGERSAEASRAVGGVPPSSAGLVADPILAPVGASRIPHAFCAWVADYPRVVTLGGSLTPGRRTGRLVYPAEYGPLVRAVVPIEVEYGYSGAAGDAHVWVSGQLDVVPSSAGGLVPYSWTVVGYWSGSRRAGRPVWLASGEKYHWNYAGSPVGAGTKEPPDAALAS